MSKNRKGFTLVELLVVIVIIGILAALLLPAVAKAIGQAKVATCASNQRSLWQMQHIYMAKFGGRNKVMPTDVGSAFWLKLKDPAIKLIDSTGEDIFTCAVLGSGLTGVCEFRGPTPNVNTKKDGEFVGMDQDQNHDSQSSTPSANAIRKSGDVFEVVSGSGEYSSAQLETAP